MLWGCRASSAANLALAASASFLSWKGVFFAAIPILPALKAANFALEMLCGKKGVWEMRKREGGQGGCGQRNGT